MKNKAPFLKQIVLSLVVISFLFLSGCGTVPDENGVTIQKNRSYNPLDYIPFF